MRKAAAAATSSAFFVLAPGAFLGLVPWLLTGWRIRHPLSSWWPFQAAGVVLVVVGAAILVPAFVRFVVEGSGTPAPVAPTERLVVSGSYRYVRNPMYLALVAIVIGEALILGHVVLLGYAATACAATAAFVHWYEEPVLARRFGAAYEAYRRAVPAWRPRLRPWEPGELDLT